MLTEEQQHILIEQCKKATDEINKLVAQRDQLVEALNSQTKLLQESTESCNMLVAFIKSRGMKPPPPFAA
jgi:hypothetical protein